MCSDGCFPGIVNIGMERKLDVFLILNGIGNDHAENEGGERV